MQGHRLASTVSHNETSKGASRLFAIEVSGFFPGEGSTGAGPLPGEGEGADVAPNTDGPGKPGAGEKCGGCLESGREGTRHEWSPCRLFDDLPAKVTVAIEAQIWWVCAPIEPLSIAVDDKVVAYRVGPSQPVPTSFS